MKVSRGVDLLVVGSIGYDSVVTPEKSCKEMLGGSATYFSIAASFFTSVGIIAVVGEDFSHEDRRFLSHRGIILDGLEQSPGKTFRWTGEYGEDMNNCQTLDTQLNVFEHFKPKLTQASSTAPFLFLANIDPVLQYDVLHQMQSVPRLIAADTMNFWIEGKPQQLGKVMAAVDALIVNDNEAKALAKQRHTIKAGISIVKKGLKHLVIKRGEYGCVTFAFDSLFLCPAYPLEHVVDPTGAGDSFAGGFMGYLATIDHLTPMAFRQAAVIGSVMASFAVESFGPYQLARITTAEIQERVQQLETFTEYDGLGTRLRSLWGNL